MTGQLVPTEIAFDWVIVAYFFLGGLSAGCYFFSVAANYWRKEFRPLARAAAVLALIALAVGMVLLLLDLGKPFRAWRLLTHFNPTSALSWGVWFLNIFFVLSLLYGWFLLRNEDQKAKKFAYLGLPFALLVSTYTGLLLNQAPGKALWHSALLPVLFLVGAVVSGIALVMLVGVVKGESAISAKLAKLVVCLLVLEVGMVFAEIFTLLNGSSEGVMTAKGLLAGQFSFPFWGLEIALGALIPSLILFRGKATASAQALASVLILVGVFTMRYIIVIGGQTLG